MGKKVGIDVGGTFTDVVLLDKFTMIKKGKVPTDSDKLFQTILSAIDLLDLKPGDNIDHITLSTTIITNAILQNKLPHPKLVIFPGSGMCLSALHWPVDYQILSGELDFRGRLVVPPDKKEWKDLVQRFQGMQSHQMVAIISKFSHRNNLFEVELASYLQEKLPNIKIALGSQWGQTNFYRRSLTTFLNLAATSLFTDFRADLVKAFQLRGILAPIRILKADGGVLPIVKVRPIDTIYSGPAASVLGSLAQSKPGDSYIVVDIGGTTTDIGLVLSGSPLMSAKGAQISTFLTNTRSFAVRSVPVGGDSAVLWHDENIELASYRLGPAYCVGGAHPTPTDAMCYLHLTDFGDHQIAMEALQSLLPKGKKEKEDVNKIAELILDKLVSRISSAIEQLLEEWKNEPTYKVWEVLNHQENVTFYIRLSGGGAPGIAAALEKKLNRTTIVSDASSISNAIGAALAKPTFSWTINLDTHLKTYRIEETGEQGGWKGSLKANQEVEQFLRTLVADQISDLDIDPNHLLKEPFDIFPLIENQTTVGQIIRGSLHVPAGVLGRVIK